MANGGSPIIQSGAEYFEGLVAAGIKSRGLLVEAPVVSYLTKMLTFYVDARNLHEPEFDEQGRRNPQTLAELWLTAQTAELSTQKSLLKKLADKSLYISGFFSESLNRSLVDLDYYQAMGASAYRSLAQRTDAVSTFVFTEISDRFLDFVEVFNVISQDSIARTDQGILRLYENYLRTGSPLAKEKLQEVGVIPAAPNTLKKVSGH
jgi:hypothetical protein